MSGQLLKEGEGTNTLAMGVDKGSVLLTFEKPVKWVELDPETARQVAERMARDSYKAKFGDDPTTSTRSILTEQKRVTSVNRVALMLRSMQDNGTEAKVQAARVVDVIFQELA